MATASPYMIDALDGTVTYVGTKIEAALLAIEAARTVTVPRWKVLARTGASGTKTRQYPSLVVAPSDTTPVYGDDESPYAEEHWNYHGVDIFVTEAGNDWPTVEETLLYYEEAIERIVNDDYTFGDLFDRVRIAGIDYARLLDAIDENQMSQTLVVTLEIRIFAT